MLRGSAQGRALLDHIEVAGMVVTAAASHPSSDTADYLRGRGADYVLTVKGNRFPGAAVAFRRRRHHAWLDNVAHTMATLRNLAITLIRLAGHCGIQ